MLLENMITHQTLWREQPSLFIRDCCEKLRFDKNKATSINVESIDSEREGTSLKKNQIPFNMEKDIDRLCFENAINRFLKSGKKDDAFDVYFAI